MILRKALVPVLGILLLAGCASTPSGLDAGASPSATPTSTPSPTPTLEPRQPALEELVLSPNGLGNLEMGQIPTTGGVSDLVSFEPDHCLEKYTTYAQETGEQWTLDLDPSGWVPQYPDEERPMGGLGKPFELSVRDGQLRLIEIWSSKIATAEGAHVGMTVTDLLLAYPVGFDESMSDPGRAELYVLHGESGMLSFEVSKQDWDIENFDRVSAIRVQSPESELYMFTGTDQVLGRCSLM